MKSFNSYAEMTSPYFLLKLQDYRIVGILRGKEKDLENVRFEVKGRTYEVGQ